MIALKPSTATAITYTNCCGAFLAMAKLYVKELGLLNVKESKEEILIELKQENPEWAEYTVQESFYGEMSGKTHKTEKVLTIRTTNIIAIE